MTPGGTPGGIALFGASGRTGRCLIAEAESRGMRVRGLVRARGALAGTRATEIVGSFESEATLDHALEGCAAVVVVLGPHPGYTDVFCARATKAVLDGMKRQGLERVLCQTGAMIGPHGDNRSFAFRLAASMYQRRRPAAHQDRALQEALVRDSGGEWTIIKPPRLTMGPADPTPEVGPHVRIGLLSSVSRSTVSRLIVSEIVEPHFVEQAIFVRE